MANLNKVMLIGNLTRDPEIKYTPKGTAIAAFGLAVNRNYTTEGGEKREEVTFIELEAYALVAEIIGEYCKKGRPIFIEGRLKLDTWDDQDTGKKRSKMKVVVETMQLLGSNGGAGMSPRTAEEADAAAGGRGGSASAPPPPQAPRRNPTPPPRPPSDPDLDAAPDDIPF